MHTANYVRFSRHPINRLAGGTKTCNGHPHRRGKQKPVRSHFGKMATWRTIELQLRSSDERGVKQMKSNKLRKREETPVALQFALAVGSDARVLAIGGKV